MELSQLNHLREQQKEQENGSAPGLIGLACPVALYDSRRWPADGRVIVAYVDDPHRSRVRPDIFVCGPRSSPLSVRRNGSSRTYSQTGPTLLRTALVEAAWMTLRFNLFERCLHFC